MEYSSKNNCAYASLNNYYKECGVQANSALFAGGASQPRVLQAVFGGIPYQNNSQGYGGKGCGTGRAGECCDGRVLLNNAYPQCSQGGTCGKYYARQCK